MSQYFGEEFLFEREEELLDFLRSNLADPLTSRGVDTTESFTAAGGSDEDFTLSKTLVTHVSLVTKNGSALRRGFDYLVTYGEDGDVDPFNKTKVTIRSTTASDAIVVSFHYGDTLIQEGFGVRGRQLPLAFLIHLVANIELTGLGEGFGVGRSQWIVSSYIFEFRDKFKRRCKKKAHQAFNIVAQFRQSNPFRLREIVTENLADMNYDEDKKVWVQQFTIRGQWEVPFQ